MKARITLLLMSLFFYSWGSVWGAGGGSRSRQDNGSLETYTKLINEFIEKAETAEKQGQPINNFEVSLSNWIGYLIKDDVVALGAKECHALIKEKIGEKNYERLETLLLERLSSSSAPPYIKNDAIITLGYPLFSVDAVEILKEFTFSQNRITQLLAVIALTHLEVPGAGSILNNMLLSGTLNDYWATKAVQALYRSEDRDINNVAVALLGKKIGGSTFRALVPILKERADWPTILLNIFKSDVYHLEHKENMSTDEKYMILAEKEMLDEINLDPNGFMEDPIVKAKVIKYATNSTGKESDVLRIKSLIILEKTGQELEFFTKMMKKNDLPKNTRMALQYIVNRIKNGQRLQ